MAVTVNKNCSCIVVWMMYQSELARLNFVWRKNHHINRWSSQFVAPCRPLTECITSIGEVFLFAIIWYLLQYCKIVSQYDFHRPLSYTWIPDMLKIRPLPVCCFPTKSMCQDLETILQDLTRYLGKTFSWLYLGKILIKTCCNLACYISEVTIMICLIFLARILTWNLPGLAKIMP